MSPASAWTAWTEQLAGLRGWLLPLWADDHARVGLIAVGLALLVAIVLPGRGDSPRQKPAQAIDEQAEDRVLPSKGAPNPLVRLFKRPRLPVKVGGITFDREWRHVGIISMTGGRKSTLMAEIAAQLGVPCVIIAGDHAPPLENWCRSVGGDVWTARGGLSWYPWGGDLEAACQRVEHLFPSTSGDVGVHRAMFKQAARVAWGQADQRNLPRTLGQILQVLPMVAAQGKSTAMMSENWTARLRELEQSLGASLGPGLDVVEALRGGQSVAFFMNSFADTSNRRAFGHVAILEAMRAADSVGNIGVLIDEVGLVGGELFADAVRTFRVRRVTGVFASQIAEDFPPAVRGNVNVWWLGQQSGGDKKSRQWSSDVTFGLVPPENFGEHVLPQGDFWVAANGRVQLAHVKTWKVRKNLSPARTGFTTTGPGHGAPSYVDNGGINPENDSAPRRVIREVTSGPRDLPRLPAPKPQIAPEYVRNDPDRLGVWLRLQNTAYESACWLWTGMLDPDGYGRCGHHGASWRTHILMYCWSANLPLEEWKRRSKFESATIDHLCNETRCGNPRHLQLVSNRTNVQRMHERRKARLGRR